MTLELGDIAAEENDCGFTSAHLGVYEAAMLAFDDCAYGSFSHFSVF